MKIDLKDPGGEVVALAAKTILNQGIVLSPTDTVYGLACDPYSEEALNRLCSVKGRPSRKGFLVLVSGIEQVAAVASRLPRGFQEFARQIWPGPITVLLEAADNIPQPVRGDGSKIGCRQPDSPFLLQWIAAAGRPIVSTSANLSGQPIPSTLSELESLFGDRVDLFLEAGEPRACEPSTVVDWSGSVARVLRRGAGYRRLRDVLRLDSAE